MQVERHPISGSRRINLTFRMVREEYMRNVPQCHCGKACEMRTVIRKESNMGKYFYMCGGDGGGGIDYGNPSTGTKCGFFRWLDCELMNENCKQAREEPVLEPK